ncbi:MAG: radical SAM protein [Lachnospiraceae bacterium]|nr:radical SAM protein [Lachnospiraceae bacterium]
MGVKAAGCTLCPRECGADRAVKAGYCGGRDAIKAARAALHMWEEPCISGSEGSGTVFFSGCSLKCVYCQNGVIARGDAGKEISVQRLAEIFLELRDKGANNINLVTGTHYADRITEALDLAGRNRLGIPVVWNTGGYEKASVIEMLEPYVDIYLTDFKYMYPETAARYSGAPDYPDTAKKALAAMMRTKGGAVYDGRGIMQRGVIIRHLVLPGHTAESMEIIKYLYDTYGDGPVLSIMNQYTPPEGLEGYPEINRKLTSYEYKKVVDFALSLGIENAYIQEGGTAEESFIPDFGTCEGV